MVAYHRSKSEMGLPLMIALSSFVEPLAHFIARHSYLNALFELQEVALDSKSDHGEVLTNNRMKTAETGCHVPIRFAKTFCHRILN
jgi:hypothetical protein